MRIIQSLRRLPENDVPECAGFWFVFKARQPAHSTAVTAGATPKTNQKTSRLVCHFPEIALTEDHVPRET
jgi:hypothetical protein